MSNPVEPVFTPEQIVQDLTRIGLAKGDIVYVHSSLRKVGKIDGGADTLIDCFLSIIGAEGTLAVPTHTLNYVNISETPFHPETTPSHLGTFTNVLLKRPGAYRSMHPTHSSAAIGAKAAWLTENHDLERPFHYNSPINRLYRKNGKILLLGVQHNANTALHLAEYLTDMPYTVLHYKSTWSPDAWYIGEDGETKIVETKMFPGCSHSFVLIEGILKRKKLITYGRVGDALCQLMNAKALVDEATAIIQEDPTFFLCQNHRCPCCPPRWALLREKGII